jgi:hypothetical protein
VTRLRGTQNHAVDHVLGSHLQRLAETAKILRGLSRNRRDLRRARRINRQARFWSQHHLNQSALSTHSISSTSPVVGKRRPVGACRTHHRDRGRLGRALWRRRLDDQRDSPRARGDHPTRTGRVCRADSLVAHPERDDAAPVRPRGRHLGIAAVGLRTRRSPPLPTCSAGSATSRGSTWARRQRARRGAPGWGLSWPPATGRGPAGAELWPRPRMTPQIRWLQRRPATIPDVMVRARLSG